MALSDRVTERFSASYIQQLTNPDLSAATSVDTARLGFAATDAEADFLTYASVSYDESNAQHVVVGVEGVVAYLKLRGGAGGSKARTDVDAYRKALVEMAKTGSRKRITPKTDSSLQPIDEFAGKGTVRPDFDRGRFTDFVPGEPDSAEEDE